MSLKKSLKIYVASLIVSLLIVHLIFPFFISFHLSSASPDFTYYGVVPSKIYRYVLNDGNDRNSGWVLGSNSTTLVTGSIGLNGTILATKALLVIVGTEDNTNIKVYNFPNKTILDQATINGMEKHFVLLANGTKFKVVADKQVFVMLLNYQKIPPSNVYDGPTPHTFYTTTDGLYVGKKYILMGSEQTNVIPTTEYIILALEKSQVTVTRDDAQQSTYSLEANTYKFIELSPFRVYKIESTGNIMLQSMFLRYDVSDPAYSVVPCFYVPSAEGGFIGKNFFTTSTKSWDANKDCGYRISALEDTKVKIFDLDTKQLLSELTIKGGNGVAIKPKAEAIAVQSDKPISLSLIHNGSIEQTRVVIGEYSGYGHGVMFIGIQPDEETIIYIPKEAQVEAYFFANEETQLIIDGELKTLQANSASLYTAIGTHIVQSNKNVVLQINFWPLEPECQGLWFTGAVIPCIETVDDNPSVTLTPIEEGFPIMYIIIGGGATAVIIIIAALLIMKRKAVKS